MGAARPIMDPSSWARRAVQRAPIGGRGHAPVVAVLLASAGKDTASCACALAARVVPSSNETESVAARTKKETK
jgi:hypothetical protein